jgi:threonine synthase
MAKELKSTRNRRQMRIPISAFTRLLNDALARGVKLDDFREILDRYEFGSEGRPMIWPNEMLPSGSSVDDAMKVVVAAFVNAEEAGVEPASAVALAALCHRLIESTPEELRPALDEKLSRGMLCHTLQVYMLFEQALREVRDGI